MSAITSVAATLRRISADDNAAIARVIRKVPLNTGLPPIRAIPLPTLIWTNCSSLQPAGRSLLGG